MCLALNGNLLEITLSNATSINDTDYLLSSNNIAGASVSTGWNYIVVNVFPQSGTTSMFADAYVVNEASCSTY
jgi:hypothetical protein